MIIWGKMSIAGANICHTLQHEISLSATVSTYCNNELVT